MISKWPTITGRQAREKTLIMTLKKRQDSVNTEKKRSSLIHSLMSKHTHTLLTISWHHTQRFPATVLIFLWQTWHLEELQSAPIQSWAATWDTGVEKERLRKRCNSLLLLILFLIRWTVWLMEAIARPWLLLSCPFLITQNNLHLMFYS